ncbi:MAG: M15 family metallopeptidase [Prevotellaceae bacterium]|jgi:D-alanyl-D-alanine dipeptidase|nr:M15 family metallopeptidase [Prevotellaceae bacterium]
MRNRKTLLPLLLFVLLRFDSSAQTGEARSETLLMENSGFVNVRTLDSSIAVRLMYATDDNFTGERLYGDLREAYLRKDAALKLAAAQKHLKAIEPSFRLAVRDAARPQSAQLKMWEKVRNTPMRKYVSSPARVSMHTYGVAVDVTILDGEGNYLDMGTEVDSLDPLSEPRREAEFLAAGRLTRTQTGNRALLKKVMNKAGFRGIANEWWHFEACSRAEAEKGIK